MKDFETLKKEILRRAKDADACVNEYTRALKSETYAELMQVIKDNFSWCCATSVIDENIINDYKDEFNSHDIFCNENRDSGYLLVTGNVDRISGDCKAAIKGKAIIHNVYGNAVIKRVYGNAVIKYVYDNAVIEDVFGNAVIERVYNNAVIKDVFDNAKIIKDFR